jgi:hypothetical protein
MGMDRKGGDRIGRERPKERALCAGGRRRVERPGA